MPRIDQFTSGTPLGRLGIGHAVKVVGGPPMLVPVNTGMTIPVMTPGGEKLIHPFCPSYYNPPLAYDRCSPPRPFDTCRRPPTIPNVSMRTCNCGKPGTCSGRGTCGNCTCERNPGALVRPDKSTNRGYYGEHHVNDLGYDWQFGRHAGATVFGPKKKRDKLTAKERRLALQLLTGDFDSLVEYLQTQGSISRQVDKPVDVGGLAPPRYPVQIDAAPPSVPRMYVMVHRGAVTPPGQLARLINLRLGSFFDLCQQRSPCACPSGPMTYNPYGTVNGLGVVYGPKNTAEAKLSSKQVVSLSDLMMVEEGFNPAKNPKMRKIFAAALVKELRKEGLTVRGYSDGSWIVEGPYLRTASGLFDFIGDAVSSIGKAVGKAVKAVKKAVIDPVSGFVQKAGGTIMEGITSIDKSLGITDSLKGFLGGAGSLLGDNFPMLAGLALTAVTGGAAAPLLSALGPALGGAGALGPIGAAASSLIGGGGAGGIGDLLGQLAGGSGGIGGALSSILGQGSGGLASVLGSILGSGGSPEIRRAGQQLVSAAAEVVPAADPLSALLGGQLGILGALGGNLGKLGGGALNVLAGAGSQAVRSGGFDFVSLLSNLQNLSSTGGAGALGGLMAADVPQQVRNLLAAQFARGGGVAGAVRRAHEMSGRSVHGQYIAQAVAGVLVQFGENPQRAGEVGCYCAASVSTGPTVSGRRTAPGVFGEQLLVGVLREVCLANSERGQAA